jgi:hypothetical protein
VDNKKGGCYTQQRTQSLEWRGKNFKKNSVRGKNKKKNQ